jgi:hypothetical protein
MWCTLMKNTVIGPSCFEEPVVTSDTFSGYDREHCFVSCPYGNSLPVIWCITLLFPLFSCLSGQRVF